MFLLTSKCPWDIIAMPRMRFNKAQNILTAADNPVTQSTESSLPLIIAEISLYRDTEDIVYIDNRTSVVT